MCVDRVDPTSQSTVLVRRPIRIGPGPDHVHAVLCQATSGRRAVGLSPHFYADDSQICGFRRPGEVGTLSQRLIDMYRRRCAVDAQQQSEAKRQQTVLL